MSETAEFLFNRERIKDADWLMNYLNQLNTAHRQKDHVRLSVHTNEAGQEYYALETEGRKNDEMYVNKGIKAHTWDFILPGKKKNTFQVYTIQADYREAFLEGAEMDAWVQNQLRENPGFSEDDFRFLSIPKNILNKCAIYQGRDLCYEETYFNQPASQSLKALSVCVYNRLMHEAPFQVIKPIYGTLFVPPVERAKSAVIQPIHLRDSFSR